MRNAFKYLNESEVTNDTDFNNTLICGDCLNVMSYIPDKSIDCIITDLPYNTTACKWDIAIPLNDYIIIKIRKKPTIFYKNNFILWCYQQGKADYRDALAYFEENKFIGLWSHYKRIIKDHGAIILFGQEPFSTTVRNSNIEMYRYDWIWKKQKPSNFQLMNYQPGRVQENAMVFSKAKACYVKNGNVMNYYPQMIDRDKVRKANVKIYGNIDDNILHNYKNGTKDHYKSYSKKHPTTIIEYNTENNKIHETQKPVKIYEYFMKTYTKESETVLDSTAGSMTCAIAGINTDRNVICIENNEKIYMNGKNRIIDYLQKV